MYSFRHKHICKVFYNVFEVSHTLDAATFRSIDFNILIYRVPNSMFCFDFLNKNTHLCFFLNKALTAQVSREPLVSTQSSQLSLCTTAGQFFPLLHNLIQPSMYLGRAMDVLWGLFDLVLGAIRCSNIFFPQIPPTTASP